MNRLLNILRSLWLPLFLLTALSWLFAPAYYHDHFGGLQYISAYESGALRWSWLFRAGDVVSGALLVVAPWLFGIFKLNKPISLMVAIIGVLSAVDGIFANACLTAHACSGWMLVSSRVHDAESVLLVAIILLVSAYHARRYGRQLSLAFVLAQLAIGLLDISGLLSQQAIAVSQYLYEVLAISWLAWLLATFAPLATTRHGQVIRRLFGLWTALNGAIALIVTLTHHRVLAPLFDVSLAHSSTIVGQHGVIAGVLMLYLARHVYQGQRRSAILLLALFGSQVLKYSVLTPSPILLAVNLASFILLLYARRAFDRNIIPLPIVARLKDIAIVAGGVVIAVTASLIISNAAGHGALLQDGIADSYQSSLHLARHDRARLQRQLAHRNKVVNETLLCALLIVGAWIAFRPTRLPYGFDAGELRHVESLLEKYSSSTEDFFKIWPEDKSYYFGQNGFVAYKVVGRTVFVLPDPIAPQQQVARLLDDFISYCRGHGWSVCFLAVPDASKALYASRDFKALKMGSSAVISVREFVDQTSRDKWWRWQRNRGTKAGLSYELCLPPHNPSLTAELRTVSDAWLQDGEHREQGFALGYFDPAYLQRCRLHVLRDADGQLVAFANELPVFNAQSQRTVDLIRYRPGQNGAMPFLLLQVIERLASDEAVATFDLGFVPLAGIDSNLLKVVRRLAAGRFSSLGLEQFKNKFDPKWEASYLVYEGNLLDLARIATSLETLLKRTR